MAIRKYKNINGILLLDKPKGLSSNIILQQVKKIFSAKKAGYVGCLDPLATGMLPIFFGNTTNFSEYLTNSIKYYHVVAKLGETTTTGDIAGKIIEKYKINIKLNDIIHVLKNFHGIIQQVPPIYSAIKYKGIPSYRYARNNIIVPHIPRKLIIYYIRYIQYSYNFLELKIKCSKGTYIRTLINDIGKKLNCGAHVVYLNRFRVGPYVQSQLIKFSDISFQNQYQYNLKKYFFFKKLKFLLPIYSLFYKYPKIQLLESDVVLFKKKKCIFLSNIFNINLVYVTTKKNDVFLGTGKINYLGVLIPECVLKNVEH